MTVTPRTKRQYEDAVSKIVAAFYSKNIGFGPRETRVYIVDDMVIVRLKGRLMPMEEMLLKAEHGYRIVKDLRKQLHEVTTKELGPEIAKILGYKVVGSHSDISTRSGERLEVFILDRKFEAAD
ncbi:MAG: DUF2294 domain-containing protein [Patescibacteria group bacterium]|jgi:uncharacterized protein YbcI